MKTIDDFDFANKKALVRVDFNVPLDFECRVTDDTRIRMALPTIRKILNDGGSVILMSHLGRPKSGPEDKFSLKHLLPVLKDSLKVPVHFAEDCIGPKAEQAAAGLKGGEVLLLENLRFHKEEEKGDEAFSGKLASLGDVYVNDAFGTAHRAHASTAVIARFFPQAKFFGYLLADEVSNIEKVLRNPQRPVAAIIGGAKVSGKMEVITRLLEKIDTLIIGGGMAFTFIKAQGGHIGNSLVEDDLLEFARQVMDDAKARGVQFLIPVDCVMADTFSNNAESSVVKAGEIKDGWMGLDIGPETCALYKDAILAAKTILWNGPMGVFEMSSFETGTRKIADAIVEATRKGAFSLVGGGDSVAAVNKFQMTDQVSYVSTGGGALLEYIEGKELPGVKALLEPTL
ncbi:MAG: phosphoglycerate kinase [Flavobacteriales bacterium]|nr:phosphoglycerate kinase [Flavobacteriales bacterium]MCB9449540.1 phosphoglycerate kinase [Flavobacteriales bacterium]